MPNILETPINMKAGSRSKLTSNIDDRADLNESGSDRQGHRSYSENI